MPGKKPVIERSTIGNGKATEGAIAARPGRAGDNARKAIAARERLRNAHKQKPHKKQKAEEPRAIQPWCNDNCTDPDCLKRHPKRPCIHDKWEPMSGMKPKQYQLCSRHCSAIGCQFLHYCRNQMTKGHCDEPNCRQEHWEMKCPAATVPSMDEFPPMAAC